MVGPLSAITYDPDVVMVYGDPFAINWLCLNAKHLDGKTIQSNFDGIDSCVYEMVNTMNREDYQVCFPDCGEIVRARAKQTDAVFCIPLAKLQDFMNCVFTFGEGFAFNFEVQYEYPLDYTRPPFYNERPRPVGARHRDGLGAGVRARSRPRIIGRPPGQTMRPANPAARKR